MEAAIDEAVHSEIRNLVHYVQRLREEIAGMAQRQAGQTAFVARVVVQGHSIRREAELRPNRIGIDTGAYATGVLTCPVLEGAGRRLLQTGG